MIVIKSGLDYLDEVKQLMKAYYQSLHRDFSFQNIEEEFSNPLEKYGPPRGELLVALDEERVIGMIAYHQRSKFDCEMKRLYVLESYRGQHVGEELVKELMIKAKQSSYQMMYLDTIKPLKAAIGLYHKMGFYECDAYYHNPMDDAIYMKRVL